MDGATEDDSKGETCSLSRVQGTEEENTGQPKVGGKPGRTEMPKVGLGPDVGTARAGAATWGRGEIRSPSWPS